MDHSLRESVLLTLLLSTVVVALFRQFGLSPVVAYLAVGSMIRSHGFAWLPDTAHTKLLAEIGVVFLMFSIGLEFSLPRLMASKRLVLGIGGAQVIVSSLTLDVLP